MDLSQLVSLISAVNSFARHGDDSPALLAPTARASATAASAHLVEHLVTAKLGGDSIRLELRGLRDLVRTLDRLISEGELADPRPIWTFRLELLERMRQHPSGDIIAETVQLLPDAEKARHVMVDAVSRLVPNRGPERTYARQVKALEPGEEVKASGPMPNLPPAGDGPAELGEAPAPATATGPVETVYEKSPEPTEHQAPDAFMFGTAKEPPPLRQEVPAAAEPPAADQAPGENPDLTRAEQGLVGLHNAVEKGAAKLGSFLSGNRRAG